MAKSPSLRLVVLQSTGQDVRQCAHCSFCCEALQPDQDLTLESLMQLVLLNDEEVLSSKTLWSAAVLARAPRVCASGLHLDDVLLALRAEAGRRGFVETII